MNDKGQSILSEYVMIFFVVIAAAVGMTVFVQRSLEARVHDTRNYMVDSLIKSGACDTNCMQATGGNQIYYEYEPYYTQMLSSVLQNDQDKTGATSGNSQVLGVKYLNSFNDQTQAVSTSCQMPPACANFNVNSGVAVPCFCNCPSTC